MPRTEEFPSDRVLADEYGVSRGAISRALRLLAEEGAVRIVPRWGTFRA